MICPVCGYENLQGVDNCENCGADLRTADIPGPGNELEARLVREHLDSVDEEPLLVPATTSVADAIHTMQERHAEAVLVTDEAGRLSGIFTERDALMKLAGRELTGTIADVMTRDPVVLRGEDSLAVAIHKMALGGFRHIPLVDGERPTGIVSSRDLFRHIGEILG